MNCDCGRLEPLFSDYFQALTPAPCRLHIQFDWLMCWNTCRDYSTSSDEEFEGPRRRRGNRGLSDPKYKKSLSDFHFERPDPITAAKNKATRERQRRERLNDRSVHLPISKLTSEFCLILPLANVVWCVCQISLSLMNYGLCSRCTCLNCSKVQIFPRYQLTL